MQFDIWNRRYTGSKYKLSTWISEIIDQYCKGDTFCDIFAGTGIVSYDRLNKQKEIIINDFLYSNEIIYKAFFVQKPFDEKIISDYSKMFSKIIPKTSDSNYVSDNFGNKFFSLNDAVKIGVIREIIEQANELNEKERAILLASLLYSIDRIANTVGHYEAYIKNTNLEDRFSFDLIHPYKTDSEIKIFRANANELAKTLDCDIVYLDPPYNSRQYSRFYHLLENITKWDKPQLYGTAQKPLPENMSDYCKTKALSAFTDLIEKLKCNYILVSYNNTYNSKSSSSKNKMELEDIERVLHAKGSVLKFETAHPYFNAGKTNFENHKELLYLVEVKK
jgi:adenine-specific DNA methyltransferase